MDSLKRWLHVLYVRISAFVLKLLPDKVPVTFVGPDSSLELCRAIGRGSTQRVLVVTDAMLVELGIVAPIVDALGEGGVTCAVYSGG